MTEPPKILDAVAAKLDASPLIVNDWRKAWTFSSVKFGACASLLSFIIAILQAEALIAPLFGILPQWALWCAVGIAALGAIVLRLTKKPDKPDCDDGADSGV